MSIFKKKKKEEEVIVDTENVIAQEEPENELIVDGDIVINKEDIISEDEVSEDEVIDVEDIPEIKEEKPKKKAKSKKEKYILTRVLKSRSIGEDVKELQKVLLEKGFSCGKDGISGIFGNSTMNALIRFQKENKLVPTGLTDNATIEKLGWELKK